jgi:hypothetical protein
MAGIAGLHGVERQRDVQRVPAPGALVAWGSPPSAFRLDRVALS